MQYLSPFPGFKKTLILARREEELRHAIKTRFASVKVQKAAERVRTAKLHLLKALCYALAPCCAEDTSAQARLQHLRTQTAHWEQRPVDAIVNEYRRKKA